MAKAASKRKFSHEGGSDSALERIKLFSDAVIAIALTLLALEIRLPNEHHLTDARLWEILLSLWQRYLGFFVSFAVISFLWIGHWRKFQSIERVNSRLVWLNMIFLFSICCIPFTTAVLGEHGNLRVATILYAVAVIFASLASAGLSYYAFQAGLMKKGTELRQTIINPLFTAGVFLVSIGIALQNPTMAKIFWLALLGSVFFSVRAPVR